MTKKDLGEVLYIVNTNYGKRLTPEEAKAQARLWFGEFGGLEADVLRQAVQLHITDKRVGMYYPTIAHITAKIERSTITPPAGLNAPRRAEIAAGHTTPENREVEALIPRGAGYDPTLKWLESVFDNQGAGFYEDTDTPYNPEEATQ